MPAPAKVQTTKPSTRPIAKATKGQVGSARRERNCSVARTLDIVSDAWAFLIIREAFFGTQTFEAFRAALGIPRATLTDRLKKLTQLAIFRQVAPHVSEQIFVAIGRTLVLPAVEYATGDKTVEPISQDVRSDCELGQDLVVASIAKETLANEHKAPFVADDLQGA